MSDIRQDENEKAQVGLRDTDGMDRWHRNGGTQPGPGAPVGNTNALKHGIYADRFLTPEERQLFDAIITQLHEDFVFNKSSDFMQVELVAVYFLKLERAQEAGDWDAAERLDRMIRCHLKDLKATKIAREGEEPKGSETTPAEWASSLLNRYAVSQKPKRPRKPKNAKTTSDNTAED
jgi:hypothetical protein